MMYLYGFLFKQMKPRQAHSPDQRKQTQGGGGGVVLVHTVPLETLVLQLEASLLIQLEVVRPCGAYYA